jgi:hypothetical protein
MNTEMSALTVRTLWCTRTHQRHEGILIIFFSSTRLAGWLLLGASRRHTHAPTVCHVCRLVLLYSGKCPCCRKSGLELKVFLVVWGSKQTRRTGQLRARVRVILLSSYYHPQTCTSYKSNYILTCSRYSTHKVSNNCSTS